MIMELESAVALNSTTVNILFSKEVETTTGENISNYTIDNGITVISAQKSANENRLITLTVSNLVSGVYYLTVNNVEDTDGNIITNQSKYFSYTNTSVDDNLLPEITIYPNPASTFVIVESKKHKVKSYSIIDVYGRTVKQLTVQQLNNLTIDISDLEKGIYFLKLETENGSYIEQIIKM